MGYKPALCSFGVFFPCILFSELTANSGFVRLFLVFFLINKVEKNKGETGKEQ